MNRLAGFSPRSLGAYRGRPSIMGSPSIMGTGGGGYRPEGSRGAVVYQDSYRRMFEEPLPFPTVSVPANGNITQTVGPQRPFRGQKLIMLPEAVGLLITDIKVENASVLPADGEIPVEAFGATVYENNIRIETAQVGGLIQILLRNSTGGALDCSSVLFGSSLRP